MNEGKWLCKLNHCSDSKNKQYPDCRQSCGRPAICPQDQAVAKIVRKANAYDDFVKVLRDMARGNLQGPAYFGSYCQAKAKAALKTVGEEVE